MENENFFSSPESAIESEKDSMRNYLNIVRELSEDTNETFVNSMSQRIRQEPGQKDEIENEIRNGLAKAKVLYDLRSEDARHHHGIGTKLRHILLNKIDRDMSVIDSLTSQSNFVSKEDVLHHAKSRDSGSTRHGSDETSSHV